MFQVNYIRLKQKGNREIGLYGKKNIVFNIGGMYFIGRCPRTDSVDIVEVSFW